MKSTLWLMMKYIAPIVVLYLVIYYTTRQFHTNYKIGLFLLTILTFFYYYQFNRVFSYVFLFFTSLYLSTSTRTKYLEGMEDNVEGPYYLPINQDDKDDYLEGIDIIYWINLDRSNKRRESMQTLFTDPAFENIPNVRVSAFDGQKPKTIFSKYEKVDRNKYTDVEYGCTLSHLECIRRFAESDANDIALIMEDDATMEYKPYWREPISKMLDNAPPDWEIIQIAYFPSNSIIRELYRDWSTVNSASALAYIVNKRGARKFIDQTYRTITKKYALNPNESHIADKYVFNNMKTYTFKYPYFTYPMDNDSTLHVHHLSEHMQYKRMVDLVVKRGK